MIKDDSTGWFCTGMQKLSRPSLNATQSDISWEQKGNSHGATPSVSMPLLVEQQKMIMEHSLDMCLRRHRELLWRHKGDWKRPESNSNGPHSTGLENTSPNSNFQPNIWNVWEKNEQIRKCQKTLRKTFWKISNGPHPTGPENTFSMLKLPTKLEYWNN